MSAGGLTERLGYFAGYVHLHQDYARHRDAYGGTGPEGSAQAEAASPYPGYVNRFTFEDLDSEPTRLPLLTQSEDAFRKLGIEPFTLAGPVPRMPDVTFPKVLPGPAASSADFPVGFRFAGPARPEPELRVTYEDGGNDTALDVGQENRLVDGDRVLEEPLAGAPDYGHADATATVEAMLARAADLVPPDLGLPSLEGGGLTVLPGFVAARDAALAAEHPDGYASVAPGLHVDGVLQPPGAERPAFDLERPLADTAEHGLKADLGGNLAVNAATIVDANGFHGGMIVLGDYFQTDAIVQANVLRDNDDVAWGGGVGRFLDTGAGRATNVAEFASTPFQGSTDGLRVGLDWKVEVVRGDLFDVKAILQRNWISDGDVTVQSRFAQSYELRTGDNQSYNLLDLLQEGDRYDLIVIGGSYHEANLIFQTNVLLDDDHLRAFSAGADGSAGIRSGGNLLGNDATIQRFGEYDFKPITEGAQGLASGVAGQSLDLDLIRASGVPGNGSGTFKVLYVEGDYYNLNLISQVNVIADMDTAIQVLRNGAGAAEGEVWSGENRLINAAGIVQVGGTSDYQYLAGDHYEQAVLVQANMIEDEDAVARGEFDALAPEIVAFLDDGDPTNNEAPALQPVGYVDQGDVMSSILH